MGDVMPSIMGGQGVGGIAASLVDIFCKMLYEDEVQAASLFFVIPAIFMVVTVGIYLYMQRLPSYQERLLPNEQITMEEEEEKAGLVEGEQEKKSNEDTLLSVILDFQNGVAKYMFCVFFAFVVTLGELKKILSKSVLNSGVFPGIVVTVQPSSYTKDVDEANVFYDKFFTTIVGKVPFKFLPKR